MAYTQQRFRPRVPSSIYSVPTAQAIDNDPMPFPTLSGGDISNVHIAHAIERRKALQMLTGSGKALCSDGIFREPSAAKSSESQRRLLDTHGLASSIEQPRTDKYQHDSAYRVEPRTPMRIMTRHGTIRCANEVATSRSNAPIATVEANQQVHRATQTHAPPEDGLKPVQFRDLTLAQLFPPIRASERRYVRLDTEVEAPMRRPSLVRKISDSVKGTIRRCGLIDKGSFSRSFKRRKRRGRNQSRPRTHTAPIESGQFRPFSFEDSQVQEKHVSDSDDSVGSRDNYQRDMSFRKFSSEKTESTSGTDPQSSSGRSSAEKVIRRKPAVGYLHGAMHITPPAKVVRDPDRGTLFGDFIEARTAPPRDAAVSRDPPPVPPLPLDYTLSQPDLIPEPLRVPSVRTAAQPSRKESVRKWVDTSAKAWMPPEPRIDPRRPVPEDQSISTSSACDGALDHSVWGPLPDPVEDIIDAYTEQWELDTERYRAFKALPASPTLCKIAIQNDVTSREIFIDTFDRGSHTSFVANQRISSTDEAICDFDGFGKRLYDEYTRKQVAGKAGCSGEDEYSYI